MSTRVSVTRHEVLRALDSAIVKLHAHADHASDDEAARLVGLDPSLRELRDAFARATSPRDDADADTDGGAP